MNTPHKFIAQLRASGTDHWPALVKVLRALLPEAENSLRQDKIEQIITNVSGNVYDDFKTELATPKIQLYQDLHDAGLPEIAELVVQGVFDD